MELIIKAQNGDGEAMKEIMEKFKSYVSRYTYCISIKGMDNEYV